MMRPIPLLSLGALTILELEPPDMVTCAAAAGFDCVGLRLLPGTTEEVQHPMVGDTPMVRETVRRVSDLGVRVLDIEIFRLKPATRVEDYRPVLETGARLGATEALVAGNDPDEARVIENFAAFCDLASEFGIAASIEPMPWTDTKTVRQGARVVTAAGRRNAGVLIDPIHFDRADNRLDDIREVPRARFRYMQICDAPAARPRDLETLLHQARAERLMPGDGELDLRGLLRAMPRDIPVSLEIPMKTLAQTVPAVERARRMLAKTRKLLQEVD
jgi:sugar phosphate isomerase/epimerase